jgi:hypothetical protein
MYQKENLVYIVFLLAEVFVKEIAEVMHSSTKSPEPELI